MKLRFWGAPVAVLLLSLSWLCLAAHAETACESEAAPEYLPPLPRGCQKQRISATGEMTFGVLQSPGRLARKAWERQVLFFFGERYLDWEKAACKKVFCVRATFAGSRRCNYSAFPCASDTDPAALAALSTRQIPPREVRGSRPVPAPAGEAPRLAASEAHSIPLPPAPRLEPPRPAAREPYRTPPPAAPMSDEPHIATKEAPHREPLTGAEIKELQELLKEAGYRVWADGIPGGQTERALSRWQRKRRLADDGRIDRASLEILRHAYAARGGTGSR